MPHKACALPAREKVLPNITIWKGLLLDVHRASEKIACDWWIEHVVAKNHPKQYASNLLASLMWCFSLLLKKCTLDIHNVLENNYHIDEFDTPSVIHPNTRRCSPLRSSLQSIVNVSFQGFRPPCSESRRTCERIQILQIICRCSITSCVLHLKISYLYHIRRFCQDFDTISCKVSSFTVFILFPFCLHDLMVHTSNDNYHKIIWYMWKISHAIIIIINLNIPYPNTNLCVVTYLILNDHYIT